MKSGFVSFIGRPNAGKSTLLNRLVGSKLAIVSDKPQTTRTRILGVRNYPDAQVVFLDTPGIHRPLHRMNVRMVDTAVQTIKEVDVLGLVVDASEPPGKGERFVVDLVKDAAAPDPHFVHAAPIHLENLHAQAVDVDALADRRHSAEVRHQEAADRLEPFALDLDAQALRDFVDVHFAVEHEPAATLVDDRLRLHVVLVPDLADDLLEHVLDRDQSGRAAVFVDDNRDLRLLPLELFEQLGNPLALGNDDGGPQE